MLVKAAPAEEGGEWSQKRACVGKGSENKEKQDLVTFEIPLSTTHDVQSSEYVKSLLLRWAEMLPLPHPAVRKAGPETLFLVWLADGTAPKNS